jgi:hypothetical protein
MMHVNIAAVCSWVLDQASRAQIPSPALHMPLMIPAAPVDLLPAPCFSAAVATPHPAAAAAAAACLLQRC